MVNKMMDDGFRQSISRMVEGDISSLLSARRALEDMSIADLSQTEDANVISVLYTARSFVCDVMANLGGDTMFSFPSYDVELTEKLGIIVRYTGEFLAEVLVEKGEDISRAYQRFSHAVRAYYRLLHDMEDLAHKSNMRELNGTPSNDSSGGGRL